MSDAGYSALDPCVHCGFCLPACPTYLATGDEADSPRGRIVLMRALERGELGADDDALVQHLDACLGCRGCEPVCPSGVGYGRGLEAARTQLHAVRGSSPLARLVLGVFRREWVWRPLFTLARAFRASGVPRWVAGGGRMTFGMGMLAASGPGGWGAQRMGATRGSGARGGAGPVIPSTIVIPSGARDLLARGSNFDNSARGDRGSVALFRGCVMDTLFTHVHDATRRTLQANGYLVREVTGQVCCGALHEHAGDRDAARALAAENLRAFADTADFVVVNSAGCGALLKDYGHLLGTDAAAAFGAKVRDVAELLAAAGPRRGGELELEVAYDAPCHLQHAQRVQDAPLAVLGAVPGLRLRLLPGSDRCCGSAGVYAMLRPDMARAVLDAKIESFAAAEPMPQVVATGNPGCLMQIGAGIAAAALPIRVAHPVELLDESYRRAGMYG